MMGVFRLGICALCFMICFLSPAFSKEASFWFFNGLDENFEEVPEKEDPFDFLEDELLWQWLPSSLREARVFSQSGVFSHPLAEKMTIWQSINLEISDFDLPFPVKIRGIWKENFYSYANTVPQRGSAKISVDEKFFSFEVGGALFDYAGTSFEIMVGAAWRWWTSMPDDPGLHLGYRRWSPLLSMVAHTPKVWGERGGIYTSAQFLPFYGEYSIQIRPYYAFEKGNGTIGLELMGDQTPNELSLKIGAYFFGYHLPWKCLPDMALNASAGIDLPITGENSGKHAPYIAFHIEVPL